MEIREIWGVPYARCEAFFLSQDDVRKRAEGQFCFGDCEIRLVALPSLERGPLRFPQTELRLTGSGEDAREIHRRFVLRFISAGA